jgi:hypothetical protein
MQRHSVRLAIVLLLGLCVGIPQLFAQSGNLSRRLYLPMVRTAALTSLETAAFRVNAPYFAVADVDERFSELAVFWYGAVTPTTNYTDVRIGYNDTELFVYLATFDRRLWYDTSPATADLTAWDAATLYVDRGTGATLGAQSYRFRAQLNNGDAPAFRSAARGSNGAWAAANVAFSAEPGWRGERINDDTDDRGWAMTFRIPFSSLGLSGPPAPGSVWRMAVQTHDRDDRAGTPIPDQIWPPAASSTAPAGWGELAFGAPSYTPAPSGNPTTYIVRAGSGTNTPDGGVGGGATCGDGLDFWSEWGDATEAPVAGDFNVQNQSNIDDWPCFAKYYISFPLAALPPGQVVVKAELILHQSGNSQPEEATRSLIQAFRVAEDWTPGQLTWNNAPPARENIGSGWVEPLPGFPGWPGVPRTIDVSLGAAQAYAAGEPLRLALYSADSDYHSGKYFVSAKTGDWNAVARPTLVITLGSKR